MLIIGLALWFLTLGSHTYWVIHKFGCRILDLPLDETMDNLAIHTPADYSFDMDRLTGWTEMRKAVTAERTLAQVEALRRTTAFRTWTRICPER